jgi:transposase-like protein
MKALEMGRTGRGSVFERHRTEAIAERLAWDVADLVLSEGQKPDHAINEVAEDFGVSRETARRAWKLHKTRALADMARVKAQAKALRQRWDDAGGADGAKARHETRMREWAEECIRTRPEWVADLVRRGLVSPPDPS